MPRRISVQIASDARPPLRPFFGNRLTGLRPLIRAAVDAALRHESVSDAIVDVAIIGDDAMCALNARYLGKDAPTDVIAFALYDEGESPVGDVYIDAAQAARQAAELGEPARAELVRLAVHGALHVLGYEHPKGRARLRSPMWRAQERIVAQVLALTPVHSNPSTRI